MNYASGPGTSYGILISIPFGATVSVLDISNSSWYKVTYSGKTGYVSSQYIQVTLNPTPTPKPTPDTHAKAYTYADPNAETDFHAYAKAHAGTGSENDSVRICADGLERPDDVLQRSEHHV